MKDACELITVRNVGRREDRGSTGFSAGPPEGGLPCLWGDTWIPFLPCTNSYGTWLDSLLIARLLEEGDPVRGITACFIEQHRTFTK